MKLYAFQVKTTEIVWTKGVYPSMEARCVGSVETDEEKSDIKEQNKMGEVFAEEVLKKIRPSEDQIIKEMEAKGYTVHRLFGGALVFEASQPKKMVVKEADEWTTGRLQTSMGDYLKTFSVPNNAKNIHCTYEVEE